MQDKLLQTYLNTFTAWAEDKGYCVYFEENGDNCICPISKLIEIDSSESLTKQMYCLLHECGHVLILENKSFWDYPQKRLLCDNTRQSDRERVFTVIEEVEAWKRGFKLAQRLKIPISKTTWEAEMLDAIKKYIDWASN